MKQPKLPPVLTRADFDDDEEFALYVSTEAGEWSSTGDLAAQQQSWKAAAIATLQAKGATVSLASCKGYFNKLWQHYGYQPCTTLVGQKYRQA